MDGQVGRDSAGALHGCCGSGPSPAGSSHGSRELSGWAVVSSEGRLGADLLPSSPGGWQHSAPCMQSHWASVSHSLSSRGCPQSCHVALSLGQLTHGCF